MHDNTEADNPCEYFLIKYKLWTRQNDSIFPKQLRITALIVSKISRVKWGIAMEEVLFERTIKFAC